MGSIAKKIKKAVRRRAGVEKTVEQMIQEQGRKNMAKEELHEGDEAAIDKEMVELGVGALTQQTLGPEAVLNGTEAEGGDDSAGNDNE